LILAGNNLVGKTCLVASYLKGNPDRSPAPTVAPAFSSRQLRRRDGSLVVLEIWDTAGQEEYVSMSRLFFRDATVALLCFDPKGPDYISGAKTWAERVFEEVPECRVFAVMTKSDQYSPHELTTTFEEAQLSLESVGFAKFFVTSSITRDGVDALFEEAVEVRPGQNADSVPVPQTADGNGCC
jgi:small GTP-binding protein